MGARSALPKRCRFLLTHVDIQRKRGLLTILSKEAVPSRYAMIVSNFYYKSHQLLTMSRKESSDVQDDTVGKPRTTQHVNPWVVLAACVLISKVNLPRNGLTKFIMSRALEV